MNCLRSRWRPLLLSGAFLLLASTSMQDSKSLILKFGGSGPPPWN